VHGDLHLIATENITGVAHAHSAFPLQQMKEMGQGSAHQRAQEKQGVEEGRRVHCVVIERAGLHIRRCRQRGLSGLREILVHQLCKERVACPNGSVFGADGLRLQECLLMRVRNETCVGDERTCSAKSKS